MHWNRIMNPATDAAFSELLQFGVAIFHAHGIDVIHVLAIFRRFGKDKARGMAEQFVVTFSIPAALFVTLREVFQFDAQNRALDAIHATVPADHAVVIFFGLAVIAQRHHGVAQ